MDAYAARALRRPIVIGSVVANPAERTLKGRALERLGWQHTVG